MGISFWKLWSSSLKHRPNSMSLELEFPGFLFGELRWLGSMLVGGMEFHKTY